MATIFTLISYLLKIVKLIKGVEAAKPVVDDAANGWREVYDKWVDIIG